MKTATKKRSEHRNRKTFTLLDWLNSAFETILFSHCVWKWEGWWASLRNFLLPINHWNNFSQAQVWFWTLPFNPYKDVCWWNTKLCLEVVTNSENMIVKQPVELDLVFYRKQNSFLFYKNRIAQWSGQVASALPFFYRPNASVLPEFLLCPVSHSFFVSFLLCVFRTFGFISG